MKLKGLLICILLICFYLIRAQEYEIIRMEPGHLIPGEENSVSLILNRNIEASDSINDLSIIQPNGELISTEHIYFPEFHDSVVYGTFFIPESFYGAQALFKFEVHDWTEGFSTSRFIISKDTITIGDHITSVIPTILCTVNVNDNKNEIIWEPQYPNYVDSIYIYKETSVSDEFSKIGSRSVSQTSVFVDDYSEATTHSNRYTIAYGDSSGNVSKMDSPHKTLHLTLGQGINGSVNLIWEKYEGFEYSTFHIYRGATKDGMLEIAEIASNLFTFTDQNPLISEQLFYQVVIENPTTCNVAEAKSTETSYATTKSNFVEHSLNSTHDMKAEDELLEVWPNPSNNNVFIKLDDGESSFLSIELLDINGRIVLENTVVPNGSNLDLSAVPSGIYNLQVIQNETLYNKTLIKN